MRVGGGPGNDEGRFLDMVRGKAGPDVRDKHGNTALIAAAIADDIKAARALVRGGADVNAENAHGETALMMAAGSGGAELIAVLLGAGARPDTLDASGGTALMRAAHRGDGAIVKALEKAGSVVNTEDWLGRSALSIAAMSGNFEAAAALIDGGATLPSSGTARHGNGTLTARGSIEFESDTDLRSAMTRVFDVFVSSCESRMPEYTIVADGYEFFDAEGMMILGVKLYSPMEYSDVRKVPYERIERAMAPGRGIRFGCAIRITPGRRGGATERHEMRGTVSASPNGLAVAARVDPKLTIRLYDRNAAAAGLLAAVALGDSKLVGRLLAEGADANAKDMKGRSALVWAAMMARLDAAKLLLKKGADARGALGTLARLGFPDGVRFLEDLPGGKK